MLKKILTAGLLPFLLGAGVCAAADATPAVTAATTTASPVSVQAPQADQPDLVSYPLVLEYHQIAPVAHNDLDVSLENFKTELDWLQDTGLPARYRSGRGDARIELRLRSLQRLPASLAFTATGDFRVLDFADIGDMERDPFARRHIRMGAGGQR